MNFNGQHTKPAKAKKIDLLAKEMNDDVPAVTDEEIFFAKERHKQHMMTPDEGVSEEVLRKYFFKKYGF